MASITEQMKQPCPVCEHPFTEHSKITGCTHGWTYKAVRVQFSDGAEAEVENGIVDQMGCRCGLAMVNPR